MCDFYLYQCWMQTFRSWYYFSCFTVNSDVFSFSKLIRLTAFSLKETQSLFIQSSPQYMLMFSLFNCTYSWHLISARNIFTYFCCCWFFWIIFTVICYFLFKDWRSAWIFCYKRQKTIQIQIFDAISHNGQGKFLLQNNASFLSVALESLIELFVCYTLS